MNAMKVVDLAVQALPLGRLSINAGATGSLDLSSNPGQERRVEILSDQVLRVMPIRSPLAATRATVTTKAEVVIGTTYQFQVSTTGAFNLEDVIEIVNGGTVVFIGVVMNQPNSAGKPLDGVCQSDGTILAYAPFGAMNYASIAQGDIIRQCAPYSGTVGGETNVRTGLYVPASTPFRMRLASKFRGLSFLNTAGSAAIVEIQQTDSGLSS